MPRVVRRLAALAAAAALCGGAARAQPPSAPPGGGAPVLPDPTKTPGAVLDVSAADVCVVGYTRRVRDVPVAVKRAVYASYGVAYLGPGYYEVDHLIPLELGGSNGVANLWPQAYYTRPWNARVKDGLENALHSLVCAGRLPLGEAQAAIAGDWIAAYRRYVGPVPSEAPRRAYLRAYPRARHR